MSPRDPHEPSAGWPESMNESTNESTHDSTNVVLHGRYVRDLSFENPGAPAAPDKDDLRLDVTVRVDTRHLDAFHEVALTVNVTARDDDRIVFLVELVYAALFELAGLDGASRSRFLLREAPRILFPWVDRIIADLARDGGLPTLNLNPPDFATLHERQLPGTADT